MECQQKGGRGLKGLKGRRVKDRGMEGVWRMGAAAWGPIPSTEEIVRSECQNEEEVVEDEFGKGRKGETLWLQSPVGNIQQLLAEVMFLDNPPSFDSQSVWKACCVSVFFMWYYKNIFRTYWKQQQCIAICKLFLINPIKH